MIQGVWAAESWRQHTLPSGRWEQGYLRVPQQNINMWGGRRENRTLQVVFLSRNRQIMYTTRITERYCDSAALSSLPAPQLAKVVYISLTIYLIQGAARTQKGQIPQCPMFSRHASKRKAVCQSAPEESHLHSLTGTRQSPDPQTNLQIQRSPKHQLQEISDCQHLDTTLMAGIP